MRVVRVAIVVVGDIAVFAIVVAFVVWFGHCG